MMLLFLPKKKDDATFNQSTLKKDVQVQNSISVSQDLTGFFSIPLCLKPLCKIEILETFLLIGRQTLLMMHVILLDHWLILQCA